MGCVKDLYEVEGDKLMEVTSSREKSIQLAYQSN